MKRFTENIRVETIQPANGRLESFWVFGSILLIIGCAAIGLQFNQAKPVTAARHLELSTVEKQVLLELQTAWPEISFIAVDPHQLPDIDELLQLSLPPFSTTPGVSPQYQWHRPEPDCYQGQPINSEAISFLLTADGTIYGRHGQQRIMTDCHATSQWNKLQP